MKYFSYSKNILSSILFIFPLLLLYEFISFFKFNNADITIRNTADTILRDFIKLFTENVFLVQSIVILLFLVSYYIYNKNDSNNHEFNIKYISFMYIEGFFLGLLLVFFLNGINVFQRLDVFQYNDYIISFYLCLGAGIWEEILFRLIIFNLFIYFTSFFFKHAFISLLLSIFISSVIFSLFHYIGSFSDTFTLYSFIIRFVGGIYLAVIYYYRGLGIAMFSHFIYDFLIVSYPLI